MHQDDDNLTPSQLGVYISSEHADADPLKLSKSMKKSYDKYGFSSREEVVEFIRENTDIDDYYIVYTWSIEYGKHILKPLRFGGRDDLYRNDDYEEEE